MSAQRGLGRICQGALLCSNGRAGKQPVLSRGSLGSQGRLTLKASLFWGHHVSKHPRELVQHFLMSFLMSEGLLQKHEMG